MGIYDDEFDDFEGDFDDYEGDSLEDGGFGNDTDGNDVPLDPCNGPPSWEDWMIIGPLSEEIAEEEREKERIRRDIFGDDYLKDESP